MKTTSHTTRIVSLIAVFAGAALLLSACASSGAGDAGAATPSPSHSHAARTPSVTGQVAAVSGSTAQVQSRDAQTAVTWTSSTSFDTTKSVDAATVAAGDCVVVRAAGSSGDSAAASPTAMTAATVEITSTGAAACGGGVGTGGAGKGGNGTGGPGTGASGRPTARPGGLGGASGQVTAVGAGSFTVAEIGRDGSDATPVTVTTTSATAYSQLVAGTAGEVVTGACLTATGTKDDTGALMASSVIVTQPVNGACGFGAGGRDGSGAGASGDAS